MYDHNTTQACYNLDMVDPVDLHKVFILMFFWFRLLLRLYLCIWLTKMQRFMVILRYCLHLSFLLGPTFSEPAHFAPHVQWLKSD